MAISRTPDERFSSSIIHHIRSTLTDMSQHIEVVTLSAKNLDDSMAELLADMSTEKIREAVTAAAAHALQAGDALNRTQRCLGRLQGLATAQEVDSAERDSEGAAEADH